MYILVYVIKYFVILRNDNWRDEAGTEEVTEWFVGSLESCQKHRDNLYLDFNPKERNEDTTGGEILFAIISSCKDGFVNESLLN